MGDALWRHRAWICCTLDWQGRRRAVMTGRRWTELFFLDEAVALAAGHRPCGYCRRAAFGRWKAAWARAFGGWPGVMAVDAALHEARAERGARRMRHDRAEARALPDHTIFRDGGGDWLTLGDACHAVTPEGYGAARARPHGPVTVLTNPVTRAVLAAGYVPALHSTLKR
ncbi:hypothetical protein [uncultured Jannaschia sp.]|uniref:hypothetical protein n=1 Tax=uncultured Jannaschia sp. TaxID=293347 RepID=UPI0026177D73|nr:hypothetical protein [uncultured Jannaschia sp.]